MKNARTIAAAFGFLILILDSKTAIQGAIAGIQLCIMTVIPALFPFLFLSNLLFTEITIAKLSFLSPIIRILGIPDEAAFVMVPAFLGGYPAGAQAIARLHETGIVDKRSAERLLAFCNNAGPSFIFGIAAQAFSKRWYGWLLWGIHIAGAITAGLITSQGCSSNKKSTVTKKSTGSIIEKSTRIMAMICAWIVLMRVLISFLDKWILFLLPNSWKVFISGLLELSIGCTSLQQIPGDKLRLLICSVVLSLGGICVSLQTFSVTKNLSMKYYFIGKTIQTAAVILLCCAFLLSNIFVLIWIPVIFLLIHVKRKNSCRNPRYIRV